MPVTHRQLAYAAHARPGVTAPAISALIDRRRAASAAQGLTGVMVYTGEDFVEWAEGPAPAIERFAAALAAEPVFGRAKILVDRTAPTRWFRGWRAGYVPSRSFDPWLVGLESGTLDESARLDAMRRFLEEARTF